MPSAAGTAGARLGIWGLSRLKRSTAGAIGVWVLLCSAALADDFTGATTFLTQTLAVGPSGMSANGVVFGNGFPVSGQNYAFYRWDAGGITSLTAPGFTISSLGGISADGTTIVGTVTDFIHLHAVRWIGSAVTDLGSLSSTNIYAAAKGVSADGTTIVGESIDGGNHTVAFRWNGGRMTDLGTINGPSGSYTSSAIGTSANGAVVFGTSTYDGSSSVHTFRWESGRMLDVTPLEPAGLGIARVFGSADGSVIVSDGLTTVWRWVGNASGGTSTDIGTLPGSSGGSATAISTDGNIIVGRSNFGSYEQAFRWANGTLAGLESLGGTDSAASDITADGTVTVGWAYDSAQVQRAVRWTDAFGVETIASLLAKGGVDTSGWSLKTASFISDDGTVIVGTGTDGNNVGGTWITHCTSACAIISSDIAAQSFSGLGGLGATGSTYIASQFDAAGDMADAGKADPITGFASGAFDSDPTTSASVGATYSFGNDLVAGATIGVAGIQTLMPFNGSAVFTGPSATVFVASKPDAGPNFLVGGSLVGLSGTITRGYLNGNTPVTSTGTTTGTGAGFTAQAGWTFKDLVANTLVTPFVSLTVSSLSYAAYTETGGPFPASFSAFSTTSAVARLGVDGRYEFQKQSYLTASLSYGHDFGSGGSIAGSIPGILALSVPGAAPATDFIEAGLGIDMPLKDNVRLNTHFGAFVPFTGSPSLQARGGLSLAF